MNELKVEVESRKRDLENKQAQVHSLTHTHTHRTLTSPHSFISLQLAHYSPTTSLLIVRVCSVVGDDGGEGRSRATVGESARSSQANEREAPHLEHNTGERRMTE